MRQKHGVWYPIMIYMKSQTDNPITEYSQSSDAFRLIIFGYFSDEQHNECQKVFIVNVKYVLLKVSNKLYMRRRKRCKIVLPFGVRN